MVRIERLDGCELHFEPHGRRSVAPGLDEGRAVWDGELEPSITVLGSGLCERSRLATPPRKSRSSSASQPVSDISFPEASIVREGSSNPSIESLLPSNHDWQQLEGDVRSRPVESQRPPLSASNVFVSLHDEHPSRSTLNGDSIMPETELHGANTLVVGLDSSASNATDVDPKSLMSKSAGVPFRSRPVDANCIRAVACIH